MAYLVDMRSAIQTGTLKAEEMRRLSGKIPTPINLRKELKAWFDSNYDYARHHINPVCQAAISALKSSRKKQHLDVVPKIRKLAMRLDAMLVRVFPDYLRVTIKPGIYEWIPIEKKNKKWNEYGGLKMAEALITDRVVSMTFAIPEAKKISRKIVGIDLNVNKIAGTVIEITPERQLDQNIELFEKSTKHLAVIQNRYDRRRRRLQKRVRNNGKRQKKIRRNTQRQRNRMKDAMHKISSDLVKKFDDASFVLEDLSGIRTRSYKKPIHIRKTLNSWPYFKLQKLIEYKSPNTTLFVDPRGTSSECPVCGEKVKHPAWKVSKCSTCDRSYDRDRLASLAIALRGADLCGDPFPVSALASAPSVMNDYLYTGGSPEVSRADVTEKGHAAKSIC